MKQDLNLFPYIVLSLCEKKRRPRKRKEGRFLWSARLRSVGKNPSCEQVKGVELYAKINNYVRPSVGCTDKAAGTGFKTFHPEYPVSPRRRAVGGSMRLRIQGDWTDSLKFITRVYPRGHHKHPINTSELFCSPGLQEWVWCVTRHLLGAHVPRGRKGD